MADVHYKGVHVGSRECCYGLKVKEEMGVEEKKV